MLRAWDTNFRPVFTAEQAIYLQISELIANEIQRGRLPPGTALPGTRDVARQLGVNRKTVVLAYEELLAQGWLASQGTRGTFVSSHLPALAPTAFAPGPGQGGEAPGFRWQSPLLPEPGPGAKPGPGALVFNDGTPDARLAPVGTLGSAYRRVLLSRGRRNQLSYDSPLGSLPLREALSRMLNQDRGLATTPATICLTRGTQQALYLTARLLVGPGDVVAVENPGYPPAWHTFRLLGAELAPLAVDEEGLRVDELAALCQRRAVRALYLTPHHQFPTTVTLKAARRVQLLALAARYGVAIIEDDYDHEFHYHYQPLLPLASADQHGVVIYIGSLSKLIAPALRVGYVTGPAAFVAALGQLRTLIDRQGDTVLEQALAELIDEGEIKRHTRRAHAQYHARRDALAGALRQLPDELVRFELPAGGMALWVTFRADVSLDQVVQELARRQVFITPGSCYYLTGPATNAARLGYAALTPQELVAGVEQLRAVLHQAIRRP